MQFAIRAVTLDLDGRPSNWTTIPVASGRRQRAAQPCGLITMITQDSENGWAGSRLVNVMGISHGIRVPERATFGWRFKAPRMRISSRPKIDLSNEAALLVNSVTQNARVFHRSHHSGQMEGGELAQGTQALGQKSVDNDVPRTLGT